MKLERANPSPSGQEPRKLKVQWEAFPAVAHELKGLFVRHGAEAGFPDIEGVNPDWDAYFARARAGSCAVWAARTVVSNILVGYIVWLFGRSLHDTETTFATADLIYLAPEQRDGLTGYRLIKSGIDAVKKTNAHVVRIETNDLYREGRLGHILERLGLTRVGSVYVTRRRYGV